MLALMGLPVEGGPDQGESPLEVRIERHMNLVELALRQLRDLKPEASPGADPSSQVQEQIETRQKTIHDIVGAELHYWSAAVENAPRESFDTVELDWIARILHLAELIGVDEEHQEHLRRLRDWAGRGRA